MSYTDLKSVEELKQQAFLILSRFQSGTENVVRLDNALECVMRVWNHQQAKIDELMLEYCPDEMTVEQMQEYERSQKPLDADPSSKVY